MKWHQDLPGKNTTNTKKKQISGNSVCVVLCKNMLIRKILGLVLLEIVKQRAKLDIERDFYSAEKIVACVVISIF